MAQQASVKWHQFVVKLGDGGGSEVFTAPCALISRGLQFAGQTSEVYLADCEDEATAGWAARNITGKSATISGSGSLDPDDLAMWWDYFNGSQPKNVQVHHVLSLANGGGYWQAPFILPTFNQTGGRDDNGGVVSFEVEMMSAGACIWTPAAA